MLLPETTTWIPDINLEHQLQNTFHAQNKDDPPWSEMILTLFNQIHTFGIKLQIIVDTHMLSKCKLNSFNSLEDYMVYKAKKCFSVIAKISRHKHVLFFGHECNLY